MEASDCRPRINKQILEKAKTKIPEKYPKATGLSDSSLIEFSLKKLGGF